MAAASGLPGLYLIGVADNWSPLQDGFDASVAPAPSIQFDRMPRGLPRKIADRVSRGIFGKPLDLILRDQFGVPRTRKYSEFANTCLTEALPDYEYPVVVPNWDNTPRSGKNGLVLRDSSPEVFSELLRRACGLVKHRNPQRRLIFIKSWNEWAEGNYIEPDVRFGSRYLLSMKEVLDSEREDTYRSKDKRDDTCPPVLSPHIAKR
jgi:hypothetical protein